MVAHYIFLVMNHVNGMK